MRHLEVRSTCLEMRQQKKLVSMHTIYLNVSCLTVQIKMRPVILDVVTRVNAQNVIGYNFDLVAYGLVWQSSVETSIKYLSLYCFKQVLS